MFLDGLRALTPLLHLHPVTRRAAGRTHLGRIALIALVVLLLAPSVAIGALAPKRELPSPSAGWIEDETLLLAHYRSDWFNPVVRPDTPGGNWFRSLYTPRSGYYNAMPHKVETDVVLLRAAGTDAVVLRFHPAFEHQAFGVVQAFEANEMPYTMELRIEDLADPDGRVAITRANAQAVLEMLNGPDFGFWDPGHHLRLAPNAAPVVFVTGLDRVQPTFDDEERQYVAETFLAGLPPAARPIYADFPVPLWQRLPTDRVGYDADTPAGSFARDAYGAATAAFWRTVFSFLDAGQPVERLELIVDARPAFDVERDNPVRIVGRYQPLGSPEPTLAAADSLLVETISARPGDAATFREALAEATGSRVRAVLVPWNDFDAGMAFEPTVEGGQTLLDELIRRHAERDDVEATPVGSV